MALVDWLKQQGRYKHLFKPGNEDLLVELQEWVDEEWEKLLRLAGENGSATSEKTETGAKKSPEPNEPKVTKGT